MPQIKIKGQMHFRKRYTPYRSKFYKFTRKKQKLKLKLALICTRDARPLLNKYIKDAPVPSHERVVARNKAGRPVKKQKH